jgi:hypothetical protein
MIITRITKMQKPAFAVLGGVILFLLFFSCSRSEPKITFGFLELVYYQGESKPLERFSFFIIPDDEDGIENLEELYLYHDREQLRWLIKSGDWVTFEREGTSWIGSRGISAQNDGSLPRGQYRAVLVNKGGESTERNFSFDAPEEIPFPFPSLQIADGRYAVSSSWPVNRLVCYDGEGNYVSTINLNGLSGALPDLNIPQNARTAALWSEEPRYFTSAFTDVVLLR